jgi:hypothetical protein
MENDEETGVCVCVCVWLLASRIYYHHDDPDGQGLRISTVIPRTVPRIVFGIHSGLSSNKKEPSDPLHPGLNVDAITPFRACATNSVTNDPSSIVIGTIYVHTYIHYSCIWTGPL